jgi:hypothetical protein
MGEGESFFARIKQYAYVIRVFVSLLALFTLHLVALKEFLLGPLSSLADSVFFVDSTLDLFTALILATLLSRLLFLSLFTGFADDHLTIFVRMVKYMGKLVPIKSISLKIEKAEFFKFISSHLIVIETSFTILFFLLIYIGGFFNWLSFGFLLLVLLSLPALLSGVLENAGIHSLREMSLGSLLAEPRKMGLIFATFSALAFLMSIGLGYARASEVFGSNVVVVRFGETERTECVAILGKSEDGLFLHAVFDNPDAVPARAFFVPFDQVGKVVSVGGSEFSFFRRYEDLSCGGAEVQAK